MAEKDPAPPFIRRSSGEHASVKQFRQKLESIADTDPTELEGAFAALDKIRDKSSHPPAEAETPAVVTPRAAVVTCPICQHAAGLCEHDVEAITPLVLDPRREPPEDARRELSMPPIDVAEQDPFPPKKR